jgi:Mg2+/citrate symporter
MNLSLLFAIALAIVHIGAKNLLFLGSVPRNRWLSIAGGVSVAYTFVHIFPELSAGQARVEESALNGLDFLEHHVYLMSLLGFSIFYGLEKLAKTSRQQQLKMGRGDTTSDRVFWLHIISFALYNTLIGYLVSDPEQESSVLSLFFFFIAMALHFVVNDFGLREHHKRVYDRTGRWVLAGSVILGWAIGSATTISHEAIALLFAFLAGGIILNILKEELPEERETQFWAFAAGAGVYSVLLLII